MNRPPLLVYIQRYVLVQIGAASDGADQQAKKVCAIGTAAFSFLIGVVLLHVDPFGYGAATKRFTENLAFQLVGPFYPSHHDRNVTVLLFEDQGLDKLGGTWPLKFRQHADILRNLIDMRPAAVMVDVLFLDNRRASGNSIQPLLDVLSAAASGEEGGVPVFLATTNMSEDANPVLRAFTSTPVGEAETDAPSVLRDDVRYATISWVNCADSRFYYPLKFWSIDDSAMDERRLVCDDDAIEQDGTLNEDDEAGERRDPDDEDDEKIPVAARQTSPAFAIYRHLCGTRWNYKCPETYPNEGDYQDPMYVYWNARPAYLNAYQSRRGMYCTDYDGFGSYIYARLTDAFDDDYQNCLPASTILVRDFLDDDFRKVPDVMKAVMDNVVFYGVALTGVEDLVETPNHGPVPGVYLHAMATDNLLALGRDYQKPPKAVFLGLNEAQLLEVIMFGAFVVASAALVMRRPGSRILWVERSWQWLLVTPAFWLLVIVVAVVQFAILKVVPINALGLSAMAPLSPVMLRFLCSKNV